MFIYLVLLAYFLFFSEALGRNVSESYRYNLEPFKEIRRFYTYRDTLGMSAFLLNIVGNVAAFVPFGILRPLIGQRRHNFYRTMFQGFLFSLCIEISQLVSHVGSFDVDDIILNTAGILVGYILFLIFYTLCKRRRKYYVKKN